MKVKAVDFPLKKLFIDIFKDQIYLVGGTIRDRLLYGETENERDIDLMVVGHTYDEIEAKLKRHGKTNTVGKSFAVVKFSKFGRVFDLSIPRRDVKRDKNSHSHQNFDIECGPHIPLEEDLKRRDFTCNSIAMRLSDNKIVDPFNGVQAIREKRILMTGPESFLEDPLRILRAARFASVLKFTVDESIYMGAKNVRLDELSKERIREEWFRLLLESERPSIGMNEYFKLTVLEKLFPPFYPLSLTIQDSVFHPEKDEFGHHTVWYHVMVVLDIAKKVGVEFGLDKEQTLALLLGVLFHDVGKATTTNWEFKRGRMTVTSMFHDSKGVVITGEFLLGMRIDMWLGFPLKQTVLNLVKWHHRIYELYRNREDIGFKAFSRLVRDMDGQDILLMLLDFADRYSREPDPLNFAEVDEITQWYIKKKEELNVNEETVQPIIMGRHLLEIGIEPGKQMGIYLKQLYERQLDGDFSTREGGMKTFVEIMESEVESKDLPAPRV
ncbi:MAG: CCA tRNA nucleotidyltransferase [bacterium]|nr:CCA tRNA nucleotidyltransferase [bacterium]